MNPQVPILRQRTPWTVKLNVLLLGLTRYPWLPNLNAMILITTLDLLMLSIIEFDCPLLMPAAGISGRYFGENSIQLVYFNQQAYYQTDFSKTN